MARLSNTERDGRTLVSASVAFSFRSSDGYGAKDVFSTVNGAEAKAVLIEAVDEIARIAALYEFGDEIVAAAQDACKRVAEWRAKATPAPQSGEPA
jgi:hypothetical protein